VATQEAEAGLLQGKQSPRFLVDELTVALSEYSSKAFIPARK
jgi:hypothetical protein